MGVCCTILGEFHACRSALNQGVSISNLPAACLTELKFLWVRWTFCLCGACSNRLDEVQWLYINYILGNCEVISTFSLPGLLHWFDVMLTYLTSKQLHVVAFDVIYIFMLIIAFVLLLTHHWGHFCSCHRDVIVSVIWVLIPRRLFDSLLANYSKLFFSSSGWSSGTYPMTPDCY